MHIRLWRPTVTLGLLTLLAPSLQARSLEEEPVVLSMRERAEIIDRWLAIRFDTVLPEIMRREGIDMWVVIAREYNEDPVIRTMLPSTWIAARRRTVLVFFDRGGSEGVERLAIARYDVGDSIPGAWNPEEEPDQWERLADVIRERDPEKIAINRSETFALADGVTASELEAFNAALGPELRDRVVSGETLAIGWLETRTPEEMQVYPQIVKIARAIIAEGLSERVIQPGVTTTADVEWWYRDKIRERNLVTWFHPSVSIQRAGAGERHRRAHGVLVTGCGVGEVGVQALDSPVGPRHAAGGHGTVPAIGNHGIALEPVPVHRLGIAPSQLGILGDVCVRTLDTPVGFEAADPEDGQGTGQPVRRGEGCSIVEDRGNLRDDGETEMASRLDTDGGSGWSPELDLYDRSIIHRSSRRCP